MLIVALTILSHIMCALVGHRLWSRQDFKATNLKLLVSMIELMDFGSMSLVLKYI